MTARPSTARTLPAWLCLTIPLLGLVGCSDYVCPKDVTPMPAAELLTIHNDNAEKIPRVWAYAKVYMLLRRNPIDLPIPWGSVSEKAEPNARLLLTKTHPGPGPQDFLLQLREGPIEVGRVGVSLADNVYYLWINAGDMKQCLYGKLDGPPVRTADMPINPVELIDALAVVPLNPAASPLDAPASRKPCAYVLPQHPAGGLRRELFFERRIPDPHPPKVFRGGKLVAKEIPPLVGYRRLSGMKLYDHDDNVILEAEISDYAPLKLYDVPDDTPPLLVPTKFHLRWPDSGTEMDLVLTGATTADKVDPEAYYFWDRLPAGFSRIARQIDKPSRAKETTSR